MSQELDPRQVKVSYCQTCNGWIRMAAFPWCEAQPDTVKEFAKHASEGGLIKVVSLTVVNAKDHAAHCLCPTHNTGKKLKRAELVPGAQIIAMANPGLGLVHEIVGCVPVGYSKESGRYVHFAEYEMKEVSTGRTRRHLTYNHLKTYFALHKAA